MSGGILDRIEDNSVIGQTPEDLGVHVDYGSFVPGRDYTRQSITEVGILGLPENVRSNYSGADAVFHTLMRAREINDGILHYGYRPHEGPEWRTRKFFAHPAPTEELTGTLADLWWIEYVFDPIPSNGAEEQRPGFVLRLDPETGRPLEVGADGKVVVNPATGRLSKGRWTTESFLALRNGLAKLAGEEPLESLEARFDPEVEVVVNNRGDYPWQALPEALLGRAVPLESRADVSGAEAQALAAAIVLRDLSAIGTSYRHWIESRPFGFAPSGFQAPNVTFQPEIADELLAFYVTELRDSLAKGEVFHGGRLRVEDTQGEMWVLSAEGGAFHVSVTGDDYVSGDYQSTGAENITGLVDNGEEFDGGGDVLLRPEHITARAIVGAVYGLGELQTGWHGDRDDRRYKAVYGLVRVYSSLYGAGLPILAEVAAACKDFYGRMGGDLGSWVADNGERILVLSSNDNGNQPWEFDTTWRELYDTYKDSTAFTYRHKLIPNFPAGMVVRKI